MNFINSILHSQGAPEWFYRLRKNNAKDSEIIAYIREEILQHLHNEKFDSDIWNQELIATLSEAVFKTYVNSAID